MRKMCKNDGKKIKNIDVTAVKKMGTMKQTKMQQMAMTAMAV